MTRIGRMKGTGMVRSNRASNGKLTSNLLQSGVFHLLKYHELTPSPKDVLVSAVEILKG